MTDINSMTIDSDFSARPLSYSIQRAHYDTGFSKVKIVVWEEKTYARVEVKDGVSVLARSRDGQFLLIESFRPAIFSTSWEIPRGGVESHISVRANARMELLEETGVEADESLFAPMATFNPDNGIIGAEITSFFCQLPLDAGDYVLSDDDAEVGRVRWVSEETLAGAIRAGKVKDAVTVLSYAYYKSLFVAPNGGS